MLKWLKQCCKAATQPEEQQQLRDWEATRKEWWPRESVNAYSRLRLSDFTDDVAALPPGEIPVSFSTNRTFLSKAWKDLHCSAINSLSFLLKFFHLKAC